jgi:hypothetical protein
MKRCYSLKRDTHRDSDLTMLICFGALVPPLAVIIALSILSIRLALGRYCEIMEAVQDESLKEQMVKVRESIFRR